MCRSACCSPAASTRSLIVALLAELGHGGIKTFSIGFESVGKHAGDEFRYSDIIAKRFATDHEQIRIDGDRALDALPAAIAAMSEPMVSHDAVAFYLLSAEVAKRVKVVQSGQGADEVFGGYSWYPSFVAANDAAEQYERAYFDWGHADLEKLLTPDVISQDFSRAFVDDFFGNTTAPTAVDKALQIDTEVMLVDDPVKRVDNMTMAASLEARVPFLDHEVVELAARIPAESEDQGRRQVHSEGSRTAFRAGGGDRPSKGLFPGAVAALSARAVPRLRARPAELRQGTRARTLQREFRAAHAPSSRGRDEPERAFSALAGGAPGRVVADPRHLIWDLEWGLNMAFDSDL